MIESTSSFIAGTITVPARSDIIIPVKHGFAEYGIKHIIFMDQLYKGHKWNITRMMMYFCQNALDKNVFISMDDIIFKDGWFEKAVDVINNTDYDVVTFFTNRNYNSNDICGIYKATSNWWMYDHLVLFRQGVLNSKWFDGFMDFCRRPDKHKKEINHYDNMIGHYLIESGYKCGIIRPNFIRLQPVKSILGHNIVVKE